MPRGRPKALSAYEKTKAKKIREFFEQNNITRFDEMNDSALLKTIRVSDDKVFISLEYHDGLLDKVVQFVHALKKV
ncbi:MAG TPA: hypothetical protein P5217_07455 [Methanoregulaceae archaeon]|nr:hypothetical protein [Methanoregulaceae archaeon]HPD76007.1 hypothetical protein [Methanoregulaceae archaeon]HRY76104.1 hypothetical protein [Methanoregulaceae archaeon]